MRMTMLSLIISGLFLLSCAPLPSGISSGADIEARPTPILKESLGWQESVVSTSQSITPTSTPHEPQKTVTATEITSVTDFCTPLDGHPLEILPEIVSDPYHPPPDGKDGRHMGVDFAYYQWDDRTTIEGVEVHAVSAGTVAAALTTNNIPYGYAVIIETPAALLPGPLRNYLELESEGSMYILYAHLLEPPKVKIGDSIHCGDFLGLVGQTGGEGTPYEIPHLHLETRFGASGKIFPEMGFYSTRLSEEARALYLTWRTSGEFESFDPMDLFQAINQFDE